MSQDSWAVRARQHKVEKVGTVKKQAKENALARPGSKIEFNYGIIRDFLDYSGMGIQLDKRVCDFKNPPCPYGIKGSQSQN